VRHFTAGGVMERYRAPRDETGCREVPRRRRIAMSLIMLKSATNPEGIPNGPIVGTWFGNYKKRPLPRSSNQAVLEKG
jgi:hypothetical protein